MASLSLFDISGNHFQLYEAFYDQLDPNNVGKIGSIEAARFLKKSDLSDIVLSRIWEFADYESQGCLDKKGFFIALKLIALAQTGHEYNLSNLGLEMPPPKMGDLPKMNAPKQMSTSMSNSSIPGSMANSTTDDWTIKPLERDRYEKLFISLQPVNGCLTGDKVKGVLMNSKLPMKTLGKIWDLSDIDKDGLLNHQEFFIAMHLVYKALEKHSIPNTLPIELLKSSEKNKDKMSSSSSSSSMSLNANFSKPAQVPITTPVMAQSDNSSLRRASLLSNDFSETSKGDPSSMKSNWVVDAKNLVKFNAVFKEADFDKDGFVSGVEARGVFLKSGLPQKTLAQIWELADINNCGKLNNEQFALAMWLIERHSRGFEVPASLSADMVPPSFRTRKLSLQRSSVASTPTSAAPAPPSEPQSPVNPEIEMLNNEIKEMLKEKNQLESEIAQKENETKIKKGEYKSLQGELDTLTATLKQLESQQGEAQKRLNDLKAQVDRLHSQANEQADVISAQESELSAKNKELDLLRNEEQQLEMKRFENEQKLQELANKLQSSQLRISQQKSKILQFEEFEVQLKNAIEVCETALETEDFSLVSDSVLQIEPEFRKSEFYDDNNNSMDKCQSIQDSQNAFQNNDDAFFKSDDPFNDEAADFGINEVDANDPFFDRSTSKNSRSDENRQASSVNSNDDPFAILHAPTNLNQNQSQSLSSSPSPALPPKKWKSPPPRPAPPKVNLSSGPSSDASFAAAATATATSTAGFANFDDFDMKFTTAKTEPSSFNKVKNINDAFSIQSNLNVINNNTGNGGNWSNGAAAAVLNWDNFSTKTTTRPAAAVPPTSFNSSNSNASNNNHFNDTTSDFFAIDPFRDFRYEDPFSISNPFTAATSTSLQNLNTSNGAAAATAATSTVEAAVPHRSSATAVSSHQIENGNSKTSRFDDLSFFDDFQFPSNHQKNINFNNNF